MTSPEAVANDRLVPEEGVLYASLLVVSRLLLPLATLDFPYSSDCAIASAGSIDTQMKFLPGALTATTMLDSGPLTFTDDG